MSTGAGVTRVLVLADTHVVPGGRRQLPDAVYDHLVAADLVLHAGDLRDRINVELKRRLTVESRQHYQMALWIIIPSSLIGLGVMVTLMWSFYGWVFNPIRDLSAGVAKVRGGDLSHRIVLHSGDEMEELGKAFNAMVERVEGSVKDLEDQVNERSRQLVRSERMVSQLRVMWSPL